MLLGGGGGGGSVFFNADTHAVRICCPLPPGPYAAATLLAFFFAIRVFFCVLETFDFFYGAHTHTHTRIQIEYDGFHQLE